MFHLSTRGLSVYTFQKRFSGKVFAKSGQAFDKVQRAVDFNHRNMGVDRMPTIAKKSDSCGKTFKSIDSAPFKKTKTTQTSGSLFAKRIEKSKNTKIELKPLKIVDCFVDGLGKYDSNILSFKKNFINEPFFVSERDL